MNQVCALSGSPASSSEFFSLSLDGRVSLVFLIVKLISGNLRLVWQHTLYNDLFESTAIRFFFVKGELALPSIGCEASLAMPRCISSSVIINNVDCLAAGYKLKFLLGRTAPCSTTDWWLWVHLSSTVEGWRSCRIGDENGRNHAERINGSQSSHSSFLLFSLLLQTKDFFSTSGSKNTTTNARQTVPKVEK